MKIIANIIAVLLIVAVGFIFTGQLRWLFVIGMLFLGTLQSLFIWLFIDPDFEKRRQRHLVERFGKPSPDQNNPSI
ncbi:hypothetical protein GGE16_003177 [Rhizobium leguminosarum]|uniref:Uncharacterized protein n=1 Tax=Rhizobium leguminosarum TaxID=384 RepID=A0AAE2SXX7_RHILE|nr:MULTISPECIES: hypothetical protein [Rhizobium]MBB4291118.1 hypothetical protein [Rhizobium leguminosarum]MBB4297786.1 hypothetical protein [Rhizobium leguminosarum]MBB4308925.1 hypothetical protein [Rhizobium leguminosarum]MBB4416761.1 hypothetical protein [Rhizobium leguminosarum]MBB4430271.1 hypothetical protein [Rhizobium esperanzae]